MPKGEEEKMDEMETKNAIIKSVRMGTEDHGMLSIWVDLDYGGCCQGFGGYALYLPKSFTHYKMESVAGYFIFRLLEIAGVERWDAIPGKTIRVRSNHSGVEAIGHIVKEDWFDPKKDFTK
jgi:hypothetical protein